MDEKNEFVVQMVAAMGSGEHKIVALTNLGRMFERAQDQRAVNRHPGDPGPYYVWKQIKGPLDG